MSEQARIALDLVALDGMTDVELQALLDETVNDDGSRDETRARGNGTAGKRVTRASYAT